MENLMKAAMLAAVVLCAIFTSCKKDEAETPSLKSTTKTRQGQTTGIMTEVRPRQVKGTVKNGMNVAIEDAFVTLETSSFGFINDFYASSSGKFLSDSAVAAGTYYLRIEAPGYITGLEQIIIPESRDSIFDAGTIYLEQ